MIDNKKPKRKTPISYMMIILLIVYLVIAVVILLVMSPYLSDALYQYFYHFLGPEEFLLIALFLFLLILVIVALLIYYSLKYREAKSDDDTPTNSDSIKNGFYTEERRYLERQVDELTYRLISSEEKWAQLNHLLIDATKAKAEKNKEESAHSFLGGLGINRDSLEIDPKMIFVLTPSDKEYIEDYLAVQRACHDCHLNAVRGDDEDLKYGNKNMLSYIIEHILSARIVVANISNRNPNVFYEIGIAHMAEKPTILLCRENKEVPFDLNQKYIVFYSSEADLSKKLKDEIISILADQ